MRVIYLSERKQVCESSTTSESCQFQKEAIPRDVLQKSPVTLQNKEILRDVSILARDNIKNETSLRASFKNEKLSAELTASCQCLAMFHPICLKYCAGGEKLTGAAPATQNHFEATWRSDAPNRNPSQRISAPISWHVWCGCLLCQAKCLFAGTQTSPPSIAFQIAAKPTHMFASFLWSCGIHYGCHLKPHPNFKKWSGTVSFSRFWLGNALRATAAHSFSNSSTSKNGANMWCVSHFDFETRFAPEPRALFEQLNFHERSENEVLLTCCLRNALRATALCNFWSIIRPDGPAPATLASLLRQPTAWPSGARKHRKNTAFRSFPTFMTFVPATAYNPQNACIYLEYACSKGTS